MTLQIEEGKFYKTRDGHKVGPMRATTDREYPWRGDSDLVTGYMKNWAADGRFHLFSDDAKYAALDLVAEWPDDAPVSGFTAEEFNEISRGIGEHYARKAEKLDLPLHDPVNHPAHYTGHPSGVECIQITEHLNFCRGNAIKYIWRADDKGDPIENLEKARWYIDREIARMRAKAVDV